MRWTLLAMCAALPPAPGCSDDDGGETGDGSEGEGENWDAGPFDRNDAGQVLCGDVSCACDDGIDEDGDGLIDGADPECTGPYDDDEASFATGIPGDNVDPRWQDCFFDGNSGGGDDGCRYATQCLTGELPPTDPDCAVTEACREFCTPRTPNGCDCFGCCLVETEVGDFHVMLVDTCSVEAADDPEQCPTCLPTESCGDDCGTCELCFGRTEDDLPPECTEGPTCEGGRTACSETELCDPGWFCEQGCCLVAQIF